MSSILKYCSIERNEYLNSLLSLIGELKPIKIKDNIKDANENSISNMNWNLEILDIISQICPGIFNKSISLIDSGKINIFIERNSRRKFYIMEATRDHDASYIVMRHFCSCRSFIDKVIIQKKEFTCKHELAYLILDSIYVLEPNSSSNKNNCDKENSLLSVNHLIKVFELCESKFSEKYLYYTSKFLIENNVFKKFSMETNQ